MHTRFEICIAGMEKTLAAQATQEAFRCLEAIEASLSRFLPNSDVSRIAAARRGETIRLGWEAFRCLQIALELGAKTDGLFDVTLVPLLQLWKDGKQNPSKHTLDAAKKKTGLHRLRLNPEDVSITLLEDPLLLDLGGIGKGFAVDRMVETLMEWGVPSGLVHGGASSVRAFGPDAWPVSFSDPWTAARIGMTALREAALGASGLLKGPHVVDPRTGRPVRGKRAVWVIADEAVVADALATTLLLADVDQIGDLLSRFPGTGACLDTEDKRKDYGDRWPAEV